MSVEVEEDGSEQAMAVGGKEADTVLAAGRIHLALMREGHTRDADQIELLDPAGIRFEIQIESVPCRRDKIGRQHLSSVSELAPPDST